MDQRPPDSVPFEQATDTTSKVDILKFRLPRYILDIESVGALPNVPLNTANSVFVPLQNPASRPPNPSQTVTSPLAYSFLFETPGPSSVPPSVTSPILAPVLPVTDPSHGVSSGPAGVARSQDQDSPGVLSESPSTSQPLVEPIDSSPPLDDLFSSSEPPDLTTEAAASSNHSNKTTSNIPDENITLLRLLPFQDGSSGSQLDEPPAHNAEVRGRTSATPEQTELLMPTGIDEFGNLQYIQSIHQLTMCMPHLQHVLKLNRRRSSAAKGFYYDVVRNEAEERTTQTSRINIWDDLQPRIFSRNITFSSLKMARFIPSLKHVSRVIVISDITTEIIEGIGRQFWINPEFFESHLYGSGLDDLEEEQPQNIAWNTFGARKSFHSFRWLRPVLRKKQKSTAEVTIKKTRTGVTIERSIPWERSVKQSQLVTNITRKDMPLVSDPEDMTSDEVKNYPVAWEEKVTLYIGPYPDDPQVQVCKLRSISGSKLC